MKLKIRIAGVVAIALASTALFGTTVAKAAAPTLTIASLSDVPNWDPSQAHLGHQVPMYQSVYDTLFIKDAKGVIQPNVAKKWYFDSAKLHLSIQIEKGIKFTNGEALDAKAVAANIMANRNSNGQDASQLADISDVSVSSPTNLTINFTSSNPAILSYLSGSSGFLGAPSLLGKMQAAPVGSGPYIFNAGKSSKGSKYVFDSNPNYWNKANQKFSSVTWLVMTDTTARLNALLSGQIDATLLDVKTTAAAKAGGATLHESFVDVSNIQLFDRAGAKVKALGDYRVRQALNYAIDKNALLKAVNNGIGTATDQMFGVSTDGYDPALENIYSYNPAKAKELLAAAGYANGFDLPMPDISFVSAPLQAFLVKYLGDVGITVKPVAVAPASFVSEMKQGKHAASWFQLFQGTDWEEIKLIATQDATWNVLKYNDPQIAALVKKIQSNPLSIKTNAKKINRILVEKAWFVPLYRLSQQFFTNKKVDVDPTPAQAVPSLWNYKPAGN
jgi:peptide/nickel transport system substrate-binding protein